MKYNRLPYNRGNESETLIESSVIFSEEVYMDYSKSVTLESNAAFSEKLYFTTELNRSLVRAVEFVDGLQAYVVPTAILERRLELSDKLKAEAVFGKEMSIKTSISEKLRAVTAAGKLVSATGFFTAELIAECELSKLMNTAITYTDNLNLLSSARTLNEEVTALTVDLQPGDTIEIDSEFYTVDFNGVNAFDKYNGEWVYLSRDLADVVITANGQGLEAEVLYRERYL